MSRRSFYLALLSAFGLTLSAQAQITEQSPGWFPFSISALSGSPGAVDVSGLNESPAGKHGFITVSGENFLDGAGHPMRLMGVNIVASACFPNKEEAPLLAAHLAGMGVNIIRFHHMDNAWGGAGTSLMKKPAYQEIDPAQLDRLDFFISELKKRGIYANLNLHVSRTYPGTPPEMPSFSKGLDVFHPPFISELKAYAKALLTHVNPYTKLAYNADPAVGAVEINNENTIIFNPWWLTELPEPFSNELRGEWVKWLKAKYGSTEKLRAAFGTNDGTEGPDLLATGAGQKPESVWSVEKAGQDGASVEYTADGWKWTVRKPGPNNWSNQLSRVNLDLKEGGHYRLKFTFRSNQRREKFHISIMQGAAPWQQSGNRDVSGGPVAKEQALDFTVKNTLPKQMRITFGANNEPGVYEVSSVSLRLIPEGYLRPDQTLEAGNVPLPGRGAGLAPKEDFFHFLSDLETHFAQHMRTYLHDELGVKSPIIYSQVLFGGMLGARRELEASDYVDNHGYWQHPRFPHKAWDMNDWTIGNDSQLAKPDGGTLMELACTRPAGKPYVVSEYDIPAPNDFAVETWPMIATVAAAQGWSGFYIFDYNAAPEWNPTHIRNFFSTLGHPAKQALMPWAALAFRAGTIDAGRNVNLVISTPSLYKTAAERDGNLWSDWKSHWDKRRPTPNALFSEKARLVLSQKAIVSSGSDESENGLRPAPQAEWNPANQLFTVNNPKVALALGKLGKHDLGFGLALEVPPLDGNGCGCVAIASMDGLEIAKSHSILVTALRRAENTEMGWTADRKSVGNKWGGKAMVQGMNATLTLPTGGTGWSIEALDSAGKVREHLAEHATKLEIKPADKTVWYLLKR